MGPRKLVPISVCSSSSSACSSDCRCPTAALFTSTSKPPWRAAMAANALRTAAGSLMSVAWASAEGPSAAASSLSAWPSRESMATRMPARTMPSQRRRPRPPEAPVTTATLLSSRACSVSVMLRAPTSNRVPRSDRHRRHVLEKTRRQGRQRMLLDRLGGPALRAMQGTKNARLAEQVDLICAHAKDLARHLGSGVARQKYGERRDFMTFHLLQLLDTRQILRRIRRNVGGHRRPRPRRNAVRAYVELCHVHRDGLR